MITKEAYQLEQITHKTFNVNFSNFKLVELGNQLLHPTHPFSSKFRSGKKYYESLGVDYTSIDLNGANDSLVHDLSLPLPDSLLGKFDSCSNWGTLEHTNNQYVSFKNTHDLVKLNGLMLHALPLEGHWPNHCRYYYNTDFVQQLSKLCQYEIFQLNIAKTGTYAGTASMPNRHIIFVTLVKRAPSFITESQFNKLNIYDSGDSTKTGNYSVKT